MQACPESDSRRIVLTGKKHPTQTLHIPSIIPFDILQILKRLLDPHPIAFDSLWFELSHFQAVQK